MENPFVGLRPEMRSEDDEIRKGIFSRALRNMQNATLAERREWCKAIRTTYTAAQAAKQKRAAATASTSAATAPSLSLSSSLSSSSTVGTKRTRAEAELIAPVSTVTATVDMEGELVKGESSHPITSTAAPATTTERSTSGAVEVGKVEEEVEEEDEAAVKECIAAYLRSLLDRVVGTSLENLSVPALRILCTMVGIKTDVRNKIALYSILASFYYTECEKLGKRVSRGTVFERQVEQEAEMLKRVSSSRRNGDKKAPTHANEGEQSFTSTRVRSSNNTKASPAAVVVPVSSRRSADTTVAKAKKPAVPNATTASSASARPLPAAKPVKAKEEADVDRYLKYERVNEELEDDLVESTPPNSYYENHSYHHHSAYSNDDLEDEVVYEDRVFTRPGCGSSSTATAVSSSHMTKYASSADEGEWSMPLLERKVASIVQLHDPVTLTIVVKKLSQLGYHESNAEELVEHILRRFHDRQLIYYDNGIAYLM